MSWFVGWFATFNLWKLVGLAGQAIFGSRFFVQWLASERARRSVMPMAFWYLSLAGGLLTFAYAVYIREPVFIVAQLGGSVIYARNVWMLHRSKGGLPSAGLAPAGGGR